MSRALEYEHALIELRDGHERHSGWLHTVNHSLRFTDVDQHLDVTQSFESVKRLYRLDTGYFLLLSRLNPQTLVRSICPAERCRSTACRRRRSTLMRTIVRRRGQPLFL